MTALKLIENACALIGASGIEDSRIRDIAIKAINRIYAETCFLTAREYQEITTIDDVLNIEERLFYDVLPYGVASLMAGALGDRDNQNFYGSIYNLKRKKHKDSYVDDVLPVII